MMKVEATNDSIDYPMMWRRPESDGSTVADVNPSGASNLNRPRMLYQLPSKASVLIECAKRTSLPKRVGYCGIGSHSNAEVYTKLFIIR